MRALLSRLEPLDSHPFVLGLAGSVAAGKSTAAAQLAELWEGEGKRVEIVSTDGFLLPNATLAARGLLHRKGFPESYDAGALHAFLARVRTSDPLPVPLYSHQSYDVVPGPGRALAPADIVIVEGINALQPAFTQGRLDAGVYLHADEADLFRWYRDRLIRLRAAARVDPASYFVRFLELTEAQWEERIRRIWEEVNLPNLREHIAPSRAHADWIWEKDADHGLRALYTPGNPVAATSLG